jgi:hypothetical protein
MATAYRTIRSHIKDGDVVLFRNGGILGRLYRYTHAELAIWQRDINGNPTVLMTTGFREFEGARMVTLSSQVTRFSGHVDIFRMNTDEHTAYRAADLLSRKSGQRYGWWVIWVSFLWHLMFVRLLLRTEPDGAEEVKVDDWKAYEVCASSVVDIIRRVMGPARKNEWPCPGVPSWRCFPERIAEDSFFRLVFPGLVDTRLI